MSAEREKRLSALEARLAAIRTAPSVLDLEVRRLEKQARSRLEDLRPHPPREIPGSHRGATRRARLRTRVYLSDSTRGYEKTKEKYPTTYAHRIDWEAVTSFKALAGTMKTGSEERETEILELYSDKQIYRFVKM
ncbi:hypothetical protein ACMHYB_30315 [Sorangium sp. So ce1128]